MAPRTPPSGPPPPPTPGRARPRGQGLTTVDGVVLADGTVPVLDGMAVLATEPRTAEDIAAFQLPPARL